MDIVIIIAFCQFMIWLNRRNRRKRKRSYEDTKNAPASARAFLFTPTFVGNTSIVFGFLLPTISHEIPRPVSASGLRHAVLASEKDNVGAVDFIPSLD